MRELCVRKIRDVTAWQFHALAALAVSIFTSIMMPATSIDVEIAHGCRPIKQPNRYWPPSLDLPGRDGHVTIAGKSCGRLNRVA